MKIITYLSNITSIDETYWILITKTLIFFLFLTIIKKIGVSILKKINDSKKEYLYIQKYKLRIYIKIKKPFEIEDRIEINNYKGDVININTLSFEVLEVNNQTFTGQSTGIITHLPNSLIFNHPLRNYNKAFKYIWNEMTFKVPLKCNLSKTKGVIYKIVNSNEAIKNIPPKMKNQVNNSSSDYRIYYNKYDPIIYTQIVDNHVELTVRYLIHPKKARYINSVISNKVIEAYHNGEIELYQD